VLYSTQSLPLRALTINSLLGELEPLAALPAFQLALPFSWEAQREVRLSEAIGARLSNP
jgi:hypothetical protein